MKNINKDYLVTVNAKNSTVSAPGAMSFYITDILTSNIFFQLVFNDSGSNLINLYAPKEDASNYTLTLRVVKPNNEPKEIEIELLDQNNNLFIADLTEDFIDVLGTYECELFIDTEINGRPERSTTNSFTYTVKPSIFSNAEDIIDTNYLSIENIATKDYVNGLVFGDVNIDLNGYVTDKELDEVLVTKADMNHTHDEYITQTELNDALAGIDTGNIDLSAYATIAYVDSEISTIELTQGPQGEQGPAGEVGPMGPEGPAGKDGLTTAISVNGETYEHVDGVITLPDYPAETGGDNIDLSAYAPIDSPNFTTAISMGRKSGTTVGDYSTAFGSGVTASGYCSHAEGANTAATSNQSHAEGYNTTASGLQAHAEGIGTIASSNQQHVQGRYNIDDTANTYAHIVGNGESKTARSNAHTLDWDGNGWFAGNVKVGADNKILATEDYVNDAIGNIDTGNIDLSAYAKLNENATFKNIEARGEIKGSLLDLSDGTTTSSASYNMVIGQGCSVNHYNSLVTGYNNYSSCNNQIVAGRMAYVNEGMTYSDRPLIIGNGTEEYVGESWEIRPTNAFYLDWSGNGTFMGTSTAKSHANSSDRTLKENINYISNASTINDESMTLAECYDFIKNDLAIATYNYIEDEDDRQKIGFIAQDLLYNADQTDNKVGQLIIDNFQGTDMGKGENKLTYDSNNLFGVMLAAMQVMANKIEYLEQKLENIEGDN